MRFIGLDVHKHNITACVLSSTGKPIVQTEFFRGEDGWDLSELLGYGDKTGFCVMMESGTYAYEPYRFFDDRGVDVNVVHARCLKQITESDKKTDRRDAYFIARMLRLWKKGEIDLQISFMPTREQCELKDLCRYREEISRKISDCMRQIRSHMDRNLEPMPPGSDNLQTIKLRKAIFDMYRNDYTLRRRITTLGNLLAERDRVQTEVESRLQDDPRVDLLMSIPGIGRQTAVQILSMVIEVDRFPDAEHLCSYFGLVPRVRNSGQKTSQKKMTKHGDAMMRSIMERVTAVHVNRCDSDITAYYRRIVPRMGTKKALITTSRKLLSVIYAVLKSGEPFRLQA